MQVQYRLHWGGLNTPARKTDAFGGAVLDIHGHIQEAPHRFAPDSNLSRSAILHVLDAVRAFGHHVEGVFLSSMDGIQTEDHQPGGKPLMTEVEANLSVLRLCKGDSRLKPLYVAQPGLGDAKAARLLFLEAKKAGSPYYGIKFHPYYRDLSPDDPSRAYDPYMQVAREFKVPVVFHADPGVSHPKNILALARRFPDVPVVLYHINLTHWPAADIAAKEAALKRDLSDAEKTALHEAKMRDNFMETAHRVRFDTRQRGDDAHVYLEGSWGLPHLVADVVKIVGANRFLYGADGPIGTLSDPWEYAGWIDKLKAALRDRGYGDPAIHRIFYGNAKRLFLDHTVPKKRNN